MVTMDNEQHGNKLTRWWARRQDNRKFKAFKKYVRLKGDLETNVELGFFAGIIFPSFLIAVLATFSFLILTSKNTMNPTIIVMSLIGSVLLGASILTGIVKAVNCLMPKFISYRLHKRQRNFKNMMLNDQSFKDRLLNMITYDDDQHVHVTLVPLPSQVEHNDTYDCAEIHIDDDDAMVNMVIKYLESTRGAQTTHIIKHHESSLLATRSMKFSSVQSRRAEPYDIIAWSDTKGFDEDLDLTSIGIKALKIIEHRILTKDFNSEDTPTKEVVNEGKELTNLLNTPGTFDDLVMNTSGDPTMLTALTEALDASIKQLDSIDKDSLGTMGSGISPHYHRLVNSMMVSLRAECSPENIDAAQALIDEIGDTSTRLSALGNQHDLEEVSRLREVLLKAARVQHEQTAVLDAHAQFGGTVNGGGTV
jgi:hypothetical protein